MKADEKLRYTKKIVLQEIFSKSLQPLKDLNSNISSK